MIYFSSRRRCFYDHLLWLMIMAHEFYILTLIDDITCGSVVALNMENTYSQVVDMYASYACVLSGMVYLAIITTTFGTRSQSITTSEWAIVTLSLLVPLAGTFASALILMLTVYGQCGSEEIYACKQSSVVLPLDPLTQRHSSSYTRISSPGGPPQEEEENSIPQSQENNNSATNLAFRYLIDESLSDSKKKILGDAEINNLFGVLQSQLYLNAVLMIALLGFGAFNILPKVTGSFAAPITADKFVFVKAPNNLDASVSLVIGIIASLLVGLYG